MTSYHGWQQRQQCWWLPKVTKLGAADGCYGQCHGKRTARSQGSGIYEISLILTPGSTYILSIKMCSTSTDAVKAMRASRRGCVTEDDDLSAWDPPVQYSAFTNYVRSACLMECKAVTMMSKCDCLPYFFPDFSMVWNKSTACNATGLRCLNDGGGITGQQTLHQRQLANTKLSLLNLAFLSTAPSPPESTNSQKLLTA